MKKLLLTLSVLAFVLMLCIGAAAADTVYLADGGHGDGLSQEQPVGDLLEAYGTLDNGGKIVIVGTYTLTEPFFAMAHTENITITGGNFVMDHPSYNRLYLAGPTTFESIKFVMGENNTSKTAMILASYHPVVLGKSITVPSALSFLVIGGYQLPATTGEPTHVTDRDSSITIESGTWSTVVGFSRGGGTTTYRGTSHITVNGGTIKNLYGASVNGSYSGSTKITVNGGTITSLRTGGDATRRLNGNAEVTVNGGTVNGLAVNNVMGHATVRYLGGTIQSISRSTEEAIAHEITDGKADLIVRKGQRARDFIELFDTATYEDGSAISGAMDAEVATYTLREGKPEKSTAHPAKIYVANEGEGTGFSPDSPISDLAQAYNMLNGVDGTIVLINNIAMNASFTEPEHSTHIVLTSFDGERWFDGGITFDKGRRFFYSGDTTIENTKIGFESTLLFVGRFHNITFGTGLDTPDVGQIFVVGGYQLYDTDNQVPHNVNATITVESGNYYTVIGYTRGAEQSGYKHVFTGTQTINLLGGTVKRVYGGPIQASRGDNIILNIDGGTVSDWVMTGGDQMLASNSITINMKSGSVKTMDLHNVLKSTTLNWTGGTIEEMKVTYGVDQNLDLSAEGKDATYTLNYANVTPTAEMLALFGKVGTAAIEKTEVKLTIGKMEGLVNGVAKALDAAPVIRNSRTMLPVRFVAENLGATVGWDGATSTVTVTTDTTKLEIKIGATTAKINGTEVTLDSPAFIENSRTYLPVRFVAENLGAEVAWDGATSTATLTK